MTNQETPTPQPTKIDTGVLALAAFALDILPESARADDLATWSERMADRSSELLAAASAVQETLAPMADLMSQQDRARWFCGRVLSVQDNERSARVELKFEKIDPKTGETVEHSRYGSGDGGSTDRWDDRNTYRSANANRIADFAEKNIGKVVWFKKIKDERGYSLILDIRPFKRS